MEEIEGRLGEKIRIVRPVEEEISFDPKRAVEGFYRGTFTVEAKAEDSNGRIIADINSLPWVENYGWHICHMDCPIMHRRDSLSEIRDIREFLQELKGTDYIELIELRNELEGILESPEGRSELEEEIGGKANNLQQLFERLHLRDRLETAGYYMFAGNTMRAGLWAYTDYFKVPGPYDIMLLLSLQGGESLKSHKQVKLSW